MRVNEHARVCSDCMHAGQTSKTLVARRKPHPELPGFQGMGVRLAYDFAMSLGYIPCKYLGTPATPDKQPPQIDLVRKFILALWVFYISKLVRADIQLL